VRAGTVDGFDVVLARPTTFMNLSGRAGPTLWRALGVPTSDVVVVHGRRRPPFGASAFAAAARREAIAASAR